MAITASEFTRGQGASLRVTDADGRAVVVAAGGIADTVANSGSVAAPAAVANIVQLAAPAAGIYNIRGFIVLTGTAETALTNAIIRANSATFSTLPTLTGVVVPFGFDRVTLAAGTFDIRANANAVAGSIYTAHLVATRVE